MSAWGSGIYDNDDALELVDEVIGGGGLEVLQEALPRVLTVGDDYLESTEGSQGLAAADIVSRLRGRNIPADTGVDSLQEWLEDVDFFVAKVTVEQARAVVARVVRKPSELMEGWAESGELDREWAEVVTRVALRLE